MLTLCKKTLGEYNHTKEGWKISAKVGKYQQTENQSLRVPVNATAS
jgi:hypothetical protein